MDGAIDLLNLQEAKLGEARQNHSESGDLLALLDRVRIQQFAGICVVVHDRHTEMRNRGQELGCLA